MTASYARGHTARISWHAYAPAPEWRARKNIDCNFKESIFFCITKVVISKWKNTYMPYTTKDIEKELLLYLSKIKPGNDPTLYYSTFARRSNIKHPCNLRGCKKSLNAIRNAYTNKDDITIILKCKRTKYPSQIDFILIKKPRKPTLTEKKRAKALLQRVINKHCPGAHNPY